jgi:hypothetical protein
MAEFYSIFFFSKWNKNFWFLFLHNNFHYSAKTIQRTGRQFISAFEVTNKLNSRKLNHTKRKTLISLPTKAMMKCAP